MHGEMAKNTATTTAITNGLKNGDDDKRQNSGLNGVYEDLPAAGNAVERQSSICGDSPRHCEAAELARRDRGRRMGSRRRRREERTSGRQQWARRRRQGRDGDNNANNAAVARWWCRNDAAEWRAMAWRWRDFDVGAVNNAMALSDQSLLDEGCESTNVDDAMEVMRGKPGERKWGLPLKGSWGYGNQIRIRSLMFFTIATPNLFFHFQTLRFCTQSHHRLQSPRQISHLKHFLFSSSSASAAPSTSLICATNLGILSSTRISVCDHDST
ncbi:hypothetical protein Scep_007888 [Stephania cephalantha]|uniref:Uncharacterized protein n=1 Tax=Stephania cephalantha TaxID=152367 RepID=A0AAP0KAR1_9MAGN